MNSNGPNIYRTMRSEVGIASWYGGPDIGRLTATGEHYHPYDMTAAHKTLPFGTMVRVTNLQNGKSVIVRINDRGPYIRGRMIDMTVNPANQLGMLHQGLTQVKMDVLAPIPLMTQPNIHLPPPPPLPPEAFEEPGGVKHRHGHGKSGKSSSSTASSSSHHKHHSGSSSGGSASSSHTTTHHHKHKHSDE
jgi:rare lipoprotein A (peptidoglycan hydrolase)